MVGQPLMKKSGTLSDFQFLFLLKKKYYCELGVTSTDIYVSADTPNSGFS